MVLLGAGVSAFAFAGISMGQEDSMWRDFQLKSALRLEYDDNIYETAQKSGSGKISEELEFIYNLNLEQTHVGLHYRPTFVYWMDRPSDSWDLHHDFDVDIDHNFSPRATLALKDSFLFAQEPELMDRGIIVQQQQNYTYNLANADFTYLVQPQTRLGVGGRYTLLRYQDSQVSALNDYDIYAGGVTLSHQLTPDTTVLGEARVEDITYNGPNRDAFSEYVGGGLEQRFGADLLGNLRAGWQHKDFSANQLDAQNQPYADGSVTALSPSHRTRLTAGAGYSMFEADVYPYASQQRLLAYLSASYDLTARLSFFLTGSYQHSNYKGDQSIDKSITVKDGSENAYQGAARAAYKITRNNWIEVEYQYLDLTSDLRPEFDRNRVSVGWRTAL